MTSDTDHIVKTTLLKATHERVWQAISDSKQFGTWFGVALEGPFVEGEWINGKITPTQVDPEVAKLQATMAGTPFTILIDRIEPMTHFAFRWHPFAIDLHYDYTSEPTTLVTFELSDADDGVLLTITESGFDQIPLTRRLRAFTANESGWAHQTRLIEKYLMLSLEQ